MLLKKPPLSYPFQYLSRFVLRCIKVDEAIIVKRKHPKQCRTLLWKNLSKEHRLKLNQTQLLSRLSQPFVQTVWNIRKKIKVSGSGKTQLSWGHLKDVLDTLFQPYRQLFLPRSVNGDIEEQPLMWEEVSLGHSFQ